MKIALIGHGKMGQLIERLAISRGHQIVAIVESREETSELVRPCIDENVRKADVAIEFTMPAAAEANVRQLLEMGLPVVSGTTGWDAKALMKEAAAKGQKLVWKSNFSVGVNVFFDLNRDLTALLQPYPQYTPSITETHHIHKLDKPSGTAKTLAEIIENGESEQRNVPIESIREGEVPGTHTVVWDSPEDTIVITHIAKGREGFALGAILEAEKMVE